MSSAVTVVGGVSSRLVRLFLGLTLVAMGATGYLYTQQRSLEHEQNNAQTELSDGIVTKSKLSKGLQDELAVATKLAGAFPVSTDNGTTACSKGQVLSFSDGKIVCVTLAVSDDGTVGVKVAGISGANDIDGTTGSVGASGANDTTGATGVNGPQGPKGNTGAKGDTGDAGATGAAGVSSLSLSNGLNGTLASGVLSMSIITDPNGGLISGSNGLSLLASCASGQVLKWDGTTWGCQNDQVGNITAANLTSGTVGLTITGGTGAVLGSGTNITIATADQNTDGILDSVDWHTFNDKQGALTFDGKGLFTGPLAGTTGTVSATTCSTNQILAYNGSAWVCTADQNTTYNAGTSLALSGTTLNFDPSNLGTITSTAGTDQFVLQTSSGVKKITYDDLMSGVLGGLNYQGGWNATTNTPNLSSYCVTGTKGQYFAVTTGGSTNLDGNTSWFIGDWAVCNGTTFDRLQTTNSVNSVFGRTGIVTAANGDYNAGQITNTPAGAISSTTVQGALNELDTEKMTSSLASGLLFVGNGSGVATGVALSGDATLSNTGAITLANDAVTSAKIADGSILFTDLASNSCSDGDAIVFDGTNWTCGNTSLTLGSIDTKAKTADGATLTNGVLYLQSADAAHPGLVNLAAQTFTGDKTFDGDVTLSANRTLAALAGTSAFDFGSATGIFKTSMGANTLSGDTTIAANKNLSMATGTGNVDFSGSTGIFKTPSGLTTVNGGLTVLGSTLLSTAPTISDLATGGFIGNANVTVDVKTSFLVNQTTTGQTLSLHSPTDVAAGRVVVVSNVGSASFTMNSATLAPGTSAVFAWTGTAWSAVGGNACDPTKAYACNGGNTLGAVLSLGTTDANALNIITNNTQRFSVSNNASTLTGSGNTAFSTTGTGSLLLTTNSTGGITLDSGSTGGVAIGTNSNGKAITIGNNTGSTSLTENVGTGGLTVNGVGSSSYNIGAATTTGTIALGGTAQTGTANLFTGTGGMTVNFGTGGAANTINVGNTTGATAVNINSGTAGTINTSLAASTVANSFIANAITTGTAMNLSANGLTTGNGLAIASTNTATTGALLGVTTASTSAFTNGAVRFNFTGANTGNGLQIDDATASGTAEALNANGLTTGKGLAITANALTSGNGLNVTSSSAAATGSLVSFGLTDATTGATGTTLTLSNSSTNTAGSGLALAIASGGLALQKGTDYTTTGSANNVSMGNSSNVRLNGGATSMTLTGIANGSNGKLLFLTNAGSVAATLANNSGSSSTGNKILTPSGTDYAIAANGSAQLIYDGTAGSGTWRVIGGTGSVLARTRLYATAVTNTPNGGTVTQLTLGGTTYNTGANTIASNGVTIKQPGTYMLVGQMCTQTGTGSGSQQLFINGGSSGSTQLAEASQVTNSQDDICLTTTTTQILSLNDSIRLTSSQDYASSAHGSEVGTTLTYLEVVQLPSAGTQ